MEKDYDRLLSQWNAFSETDQSYCVNNNKQIEYGKVFIILVIRMFEITFSEGKNIGISKELFCDNDFAKLKGLKVKNVHYYICRHLNFYFSKCYTKIASPNLDWLRTKVKIIITLCFVL